MTHCLENVTVKLLPEKTTEKSLETTLRIKSSHAKALWRKFQLTGLYLLVMTSNLLTRLMKTCN